MCSISICGIQSESLLGVIVEASAALSSKQAAADHLLQQRVRTILVVQSLGVEDVHDLKADIQADQIAQSQRAHRMVRTEVHRLVNIFHGGKTLSVDGDTLVDHRDQDAVDDEAGAFLYKDRVLADLFGDGGDLVGQILRGQDARDDLDRPAGG